MPTENELDYLYSLTRFGIKPGLSVMQQMMEVLGHPEKQFKSIHVTGTNGKGSTCAMMESVLRTAGFKTALYTSPHIYAFNERIRIQGVSISDEELGALVAEIRTIVEQEHIQPTFFEFTTALAFLHFARSTIDVAVVEVGMGGRFDATNVITPLVSVITNVGLDHMEYLGDTVDKIAWEKAGIIKEGVPVVTAEKNPDVLRVFEKEAQEKHTSVTRVDDVVGASVISASLDGQTIEIENEGEKYVIHLPLLGVHQVENLKAAIAAIIALPTSLDAKDAIVRGIANVQWEGRLQIISQEPLVIVDGAHNPDGARSLAVFLETLDRYDVLVFAAKKGKDISDMLQFVIPLFSHVIVTEGLFMPEEAEFLAEKIRAIHPNVVIEKNVANAITRSRTLLPEHGTMVVTGSLYMIADALPPLKTL